MVCFTRETSTNNALCFNRFTPHTYVYYITDIFSNTVCMVTGVANVLEEKVST